MEALIPILFIVVLYFVMIRPQQQRVRAHRALIAAIEVGDEVVTAGGVVGTITQLDDRLAWIEVSPGVTMRFVRNSVSGRLGPDEPALDELDEGGVEPEDR